MRYWDASAVVPLVLEEEASTLALGWLSEDPVVATWGLTRLEVATAIERRAREGALKRAARRRALDLLESLARDWDEVVDLLAVRARGLALVARHVLRAADAAQLGAALVVAEDNPASLEVVSLDQRLGKAAEAEGFRLLTWPDPEDRSP